MALACQEIRAQMQAALDGELTSQDRKDFNAHLSSCPACRRAYEAANRTIAIFAAAPAAEPSPAFAAAVMSRVRASRARAARGARVRGWVTAAAAVTGAASLVAAWPLVVRPLTTAAMTWVAANAPVIVSRWWALVGAGATPLRAFGKVLGALADAAGAVVANGVSGLAPPYAAAFGAMGVFYFLWRARRPAAAPLTLNI